MSACSYFCTLASRFSVVDPGHPRVNEVNQREENQQKRIANGINNGSLSPQQASNLGLPGTPGREVTKAKGHSFTGSNGR